MQLSPGLISRIGLRYVAGFFVLKGVIPPDIADLIVENPEVSTAIGCGLMIMIEGAYTLARKFGWAR